MPRKDVYNIVTVTELCREMAQTMVSISESARQGTVPGDLKQVQELQRALILLQRDASDASACLLTTIRSKSS